MFTLSIEAIRFICFFGMILLAVVPKIVEAQVVVRTDDFGHTYLGNVPAIDSVKTLSGLISNLITSNFIRVTGTSQNLDTGKVYSIEGATMTTLNLPSYSSIGGSGITILGTGSCLYKVHPASGQQLVSPNGISKTDNDIIATNAYNAMVLRPNGNNQWKSTLTTGSFTYNTFKTLNSVGTTYT